MGRLFRSGRATVRVDDDAVVRHLDRVSSGAVTQFFARTDAVLDPIVEEAERSWPVRTGLTRRSFYRRHDVSTEKLANVIGNSATDYRGKPYPYMTRWSVRTASSLRREAEQAAARGRSAAARQRIFEFWRRNKLGSHGEGAPSERLAGKRPWLVLVRQPARRAKEGVIMDLRGALYALARGT